MDSDNESSVLESVKDNNGLIGEVETIGDKLVPCSTTVVEAEKDKQMNSRVETSPPMSKGYGLRKWRRRTRRDVGNTSVNMEKIRILKRVSSGKADSLGKQMHFLGPDVKQDSIGSDCSVNMVGFARGGENHGIGLAFTAGMDSDNSEDRSSKSSTAASGPKVKYKRRLGHSWDKQRTKYIGGKSVKSSGDSGQHRKSSVGKSKKFRRERIKIEKEYSHSSMESADSGSSNFVFMQGASSTLSGREQGGRRMMDYIYNEENSDHDAHTSKRKDKGEEETEHYLQGESAEESQIKNNGSSDSLDPLAEAINSFHNLQEVLDIELQKFQELGKEPISSLHDGGESSICIHARASEVGSSLRGESERKLNLTSLDSEIVNLVNNVEDLKFKLEEAKCSLETKETQIRELESTISISKLHNGGAETSMEDIFQQKMKAEIEYIIFSRSVANINRRIKLIEEEKKLSENQGHKMLSKLEQVETKAENLKNQAQDLQNQCAEITEIQEVMSFKKRAFKTTSCLILQLGLVFMLLNFQLVPESENVVPT